MVSSLGDMVVQIVGNNSQFDKSIDSSKKSLVEFGKYAQKVGGNLSLFVTAPLLAIGVAAVKSSANMEMLQASFEVMLGSAEKASNLMADLKDLAASTPFEVNGLAEASKTLLQFGIENEKVIPTLKQLGDISGGNSAKLQSLALVFGQIQSTGKLMGQDLLQLINAGFNPLQVISEKTGRTMSDLKDAMSKGAISAGQVSEAFKIATSEGGRFFNGMSVASKTLSGLTSTLSDDVGTLARSFVEDLLPVIKDGIKGLSSLAQFFTGLDKNTKQSILIIGGFAVALGPAILGVNGLIGVVTALNTALLANPIVLTTTALVALGATATLVANNIKNLQEEKKQLDLIMSGGTTGDFANDLKLVNKEIENVQAQIGSSTGLIEGENDELLKELDALQKTKVELTEKNRWQQLNLEGQKALNEAATNENKTQEEINKILEVRAKLIKDRKTAEELFGKEIDIINTKERLGIITSLEAKQSQVAANEKYRDSLIALGYDLSSLGTSEESLGDKALQRSIKAVNGLNKEVEAQKLLDEGKIKTAELQTELSNRFVSDLTLEIDAINAKKQEYINAGVEETTAELYAIAAIQDATNRANADIAAKDLEYKQTRFNSEKNLQNLQLLGVKALIQGFSDIGAAAVNGELSWKSWGRLGLQVISKVLDALGQTMIAQAAVDLGLGFFNPAAWAAIAPTLAAAAAAFAASGAVQALAANLADGGVIMPQPGGVPVNVAEAGQPEVVIPLDRLGEVLNDVNQTTEVSPGIINLTVEMDSMPLFSKIFDATKSKNILISANAVVET